MIPCKTREEIIKNDLVHVGWVVTYECVDGGGGWGETGATNRIQFKEYNLSTFGDVAPKGWFVRAIDPVYMADR